MNPAMIFRFLAALTSGSESFRGNLLDGSPNLLSATMILLGRCVGRCAASPYLFSSSRLVLTPTLEDSDQYRAALLETLVKHRLQGRGSDLPLSQCGSGFLV